MIWEDRKDHPVGDMNPLAGMPSSLVKKKDIIGMFFYYKDYQKCDSVEKGGEEVE